MIDGSNLYHQLINREMNTGQQGNSKAFTSHLFRERYRLAKSLYKTDLRAHFGCVNAIEFSYGGKYLASGGDDKRVLIWDVERAIATRNRPRVLETEHTSNIFCLGFDRNNQKVYSGGNDDLVIVHDFETGKVSNVFKHDNPVYGLSVDPQCDSILATACEDGHILIFDQRMNPTDPFVVAQLRTSFHAVEFHPSAGSNFLITANSKRGAAFWDIRKPHHPVIQYGYVEDPPSCMSVRFNSTGSLILALRRRLPPILYNTKSAEPVCTFYHGNYYNSCTMKSCTFAGEDDEFVLSGSDDFNLYVWRVSDVNLERTDQWIESTQMVLSSHRSIVNQVRYNREKCLLASSGVEKIIKLWSPFAQEGWTGSLIEEATSSENPRELYSPLNFASMSTPPQSWSHMSHDYSTRNTSEDPRMMAFFDSLIQQEIEGWETNSSTDSPIGSEGSSHTSSSSNDSSDSSVDDDDDDDAGGGGGAGARFTRRSKRNLTKRKERKRLHSVLGKVKVQRHKYANRIAYLIATKRNTLRRLAIKGASLSNRRRPYKIVKVGRRTKAPNATATSKGGSRDLTAASKQSYMSLMRGGNNATPAVSASSSAIASTSAAAIASGSLNINRSQRRKYKKNRVYDSSTDDDAKGGNPVASSSSRSSALTLPGNVSSLPSTSTGITSSLKDDIIRLRRQQQHIIDSDDDDDDDDQLLTTASITQQPDENGVGHTVEITKKINGARQENDVAAVESLPVMQRDTQLMRENLRPTISSIISLNITPEMHTSLSSATMLPQPSTGNANIAANRRRPHSDLVDNYSSHSNSRLSNSSCQDDEVDSSSGDTPAGNDSPARLEQQYGHSTPVKRRKLAIAEYINVRSELPEDIEANNNEPNNNNIFSHLTASNYNNNSAVISLHSNGNIEESVFTADAGKAHQRCHQYNHGDSSNENIASTSISTILDTPDSGISVATAFATTPDSVRFDGNENDVVASTSTNSQLLSPCIGNTNGHKTTMNSSIVQQKLARVRRNYRKKFNDDSDSEQD